MVKVRYPDHTARCFFGSVIASGPQQPRQQCLQQFPQQLRHSTLSLLASILLVVCIVLQSEAVYAQDGTTVSGSILTDTIWTTENSPYHVEGNVIVENNVTLTIEPGVEVLFDEDQGLRVEGTLLANGSAAQPILFTSITPTLSIPWQGIEFVGTENDPASGELAHVVIEYGGGGSVDSANLEVRHAHVTLRDSRIAHGGQHGIYSALGGKVDLHNVNFVENSGYAAKFDSLIDGPTLVGLSATGNGVDGIGISDLSDDPQVLLEQSGLPYIVDTIIQVGDEQALTVAPGVELRFAPNSRLNVSGVLTATGTTTETIRFTALEPTPGSWLGIDFNGEEGDPATGAFAHAVVEYGGSGSVNSANIEISNAHVTLRDSRIAHGGVHGIVSLLGGKIDLYNVVFEGNGVDSGGYAAKFDHLVDDPELVALSATGNGVDGIGISDLSDDPQVLLEQAGVPYIVNTILRVEDEQQLAIQPGVELRFAPDARLDVLGTLLAGGTAEENIRFTGVEPTPGSWMGIAFSGEGDDPAIGELAHVVVEYGGSGSTESANVKIVNAHVTIRDSIIRHGGQHGLFIGLNGQNSVIASSQIVDNAADGIHNGNPERAVQAPDNWWGHPNGPQAPHECNPGGAGESVTSGVLFFPFRTAADEAVQTVPSAAARLVSISPRRWYAPVDFPLFVDITVTDGNGFPAAGETVRLVKANMGGATVEIEDGSVTDATGHTFAIVTGQTAGELTLVGSLDETSCQDVRSAATEITITGAQDAGLLPDEQAPYLNNGLEIDPMPIVRGVTTTVRATLVNPNDFAVTVDGQFSFAQSGIGLVFGPLGEFSNVEIPPHGEVTVETTWLPSVSGHYCIRLDYTFTGDGVATIAQSRRSQRNLDVQPALFLSKPAKNSVRAAKFANDAIGDAQYPLAIYTGPSNVPNMLIGDQLFGNILDFIYEAGSGISCALGGGESCSGWNGPRLKLPGDTIGNLQNDPPRQDYQEIAPIDPIPFTPLVPGDGLSQARADALNEVMAATLELAPQLIATVVTFDRYAGATEANELEWASLQANYYSYYLTLIGNSMVRLGRAYGRLHQVLVNEGVTDLYVSADDYRAYQERLRNEGFTATEVEAAHLVGLSDEDLEAIRQRRIALDPEGEAGSLLTHLLEMAKLYISAGNLILGPPAFGVSGSPGAASIHDEAPTHRLVRLDAQHFEVQVGNPTASTATVDLRIRAVDIPPDWTVVVSPTQATLDAGENITAQVTVYPGLSTVQDKVHTLAVEGFIDDSLIGGVALQVTAPHWVDLDAPWPLFLPLLERP